MSTPAAAPRPSLTPRELLRQVRRLELSTRRLVNSHFVGDYHSVFKGQGLEFAEVREYLPGDDVRTIDWNVTARLGQPYIKKFVEERELTVLLAIDLSGSQRWGTTGRLKADVVAEVAASLAISAVRNNDRIGMVLFTDRIESFVRPRKGRRHALRLIRDLLAAQPAGRGTELADAVGYVARLLPTRSVVFLFSDFQLGAGWPAADRALTVASVAHDVIAVSLTDPRETVLPEAGLIAARDPETGRAVLMPTGAAAFRQRFAESVSSDREHARVAFRRAGIDEIALRTDEAYAAPLLAFFRRRQRRG